ncbi:MAG: glycogen debranching protein, partial [Lentisphaeria bacterium]|nr:glycogen debranching protein [Lentisphaeria bacterium]
DTSDAPLYFIIAVRDYIRASKDKEFLNADCNGRSLKSVIDSIISNCKRGTPNGIVMDEKSKLLFSPAHFSWMDTAHPAGTPRQGYPIEIQSLWYAALKFVQDDETAEEVSKSIEKYFFSGEKVSDCLHCAAPVPPENAVPDDHTRCNMLFAITFKAVKDPDLQRRIIDVAGLLLVPGAIRTLDAAPTTYQLPIYHNSTLLNDPANPYQGHYRGPEDSCRKVAYHNGTAWCWPFPSYCEALYVSGGEASRSRALSLLMSAAPLFESGISGQLPEVLDGDAPHTPGGCPAQAWSVSEFFRVLDILEKK